MSGLCLSSETRTAQFFPSKPFAPSSYPMSKMVRRAVAVMSTTAVVVISPATTHSPVVKSVSQATRAVGSWARMASSTLSDTWSAILSGCPSVTDSDVKRVRSFIRLGEVTMLPP